MFVGCASLKEIPAGLFSGHAKITDLSNTFKDCSGLKEIPTGLFDELVKVTNFTSTFSGCTNLTGESPYTVVNDAKVHLYERANNTSTFSKPSSYSSCFSGCTQLSDYEDIPTGWK
jgi:hypothetical protein